MNGKFAEGIQYLLDRTTTRDQMLPALVNMRDEIADFEKDYDRLLDEVGRLRDIVSLMELTKERDELKAKVAELESKP
jgi:hypothetical protein